MKTIIAWLVFASVCYSQQPVAVWIVPGNPYEDQMMRDYMLSKGVPPEAINPPIGYSHGILHYPPQARQPYTPPDRSPFTASEVPHTVVKTVSSWTNWLLLSAAVAGIIGPKFGHRIWTSFIAGLLLGPIGILVVTTKLTLQRPTKVLPFQTPPPFQTLIISSRVIDAKYVSTTYS